MQASLVAGAFVLPHLNTYVCTPLIERVGVYRVVRLLFRVRAAGALVAGAVVAACAGGVLASGSSAWAHQVWHGSARGRLDADDHHELGGNGEAVHLPALALCALGAFLVFNRVSTEAVCRLMNMCVADVVDEDRVAHAGINGGGSGSDNVNASESTGDEESHSRGHSRAASIFGLQNLLTKPYVSLSPMLGWWALSVAGFEPHEAAALSAHVLSAAAAASASSASDTVSDAASARGEVVGSASSATDAATATASLWSRLVAQFTAALAFDAAPGTDAAHTTAAHVPVGKHAASALSSAISSTPTLSLPARSPAVLFAACCLLVVVPLVLLACQVVHRMCLHVCVAIAVLSFWVQRLFLRRSNCGYLACRFLISVRCCGGIVVTA